jgi:hypothetical protein
MEELDVKGFNLSKIAQLKWDIYDEENVHILDHLDIMFEGTVVSVEKDFILPYLKDEEISDIRMGRKRMPDGIKVETKDDFLKLLALHIPIESYS